MKSRPGFDRLAVLFVTSICLLGPVPKSGAAQQEDVPPNNQEEVIPLLSPGEALDRLEVPEGFSANLFAAEPDVRQPVAMAFDPRGRMWVAENYTYSDRTENHDLSLYDKIVILADQDADGRADQRTIFFDKAQRLTSVEIGFGGVWALCPPNLIFIPDRNGDDIPDHEPIVMLDGWDDSASRHNFANGLRWGPDGWLYGRSGILATSLVGTPGSPRSERTEINCGIWRFHPVNHRFEVVCSGTTNPWGMDWDEHGELFFINTVIGHLWHAVPGAHFERMYGEDFNPYLYELIPQTADHVHWDEENESWTAQKDGVSAGTHHAGGGHAHCGMMIYQGSNWPADYRGELFTLNFHGLRMNQDHLVRNGATFVGEHRPDFFQTSDPWFRGIEVSYGPSGEVYVLDWSDIGECHENDGVHRTSGRIYRIIYDSEPIVAVPDPSRASDEELYSHTLSVNEWLSRQARRILHERFALQHDLTDVRERFRQTVTQDAEVGMRLRAAWTLHLTGGIGQSLLTELLHDDHEQIRAWAVRLLMEESVDEATRVDLLTQLATVERSGLVQTYIAACMQRLAHPDRWPIAQHLASSAEFADDRVLPLMIWYALEPACIEDVPAAMEFMRVSHMPRVDRLLARRIATDQNPAHLALLCHELLESNREEDGVALTLGVADAYRGRHHVPAPRDWPLVTAHLADHENVALRDAIRELSVVFGEGRAIEEVLTIARDSANDIDTRRAAIRSLVDARVWSVVEVLDMLVTDRDLGGEAVRGLAVFNPDGFGESMAQKYRSMGRLGKNATIEVLAMRPESAWTLIEAVDSNQIDKKDVPAFVLRQIQLLGHERLAEQVSQQWPELTLLESDRIKLIEEFKQSIDAESIVEANWNLGKQMFTQHCGDCHKLFGEGSSVGPDLTGGQRGNMTYWLENIIAPSAEVATSFRMSVLELEDGRVLNGVVLARTDQNWTIQTPTETLQLNPQDILEVQQSTFSLMPDGLLAGLSEVEIAALFCYLTSGTEWNPGPVEQINAHQINAHRFDSHPFDALQDDAPQVDAPQVDAKQIETQQTERFLYVAEPGIRNYVRFGGHGVLVFDIEDDYRFVKRIAMPGFDDEGAPLNVKGICGSAATDRLYVSTIKHLICVDLRTDAVVWEREYEFGCDRMSMSPDGTIIYLPSFEKDVWYILDAETGDEITRVEPRSRAHNTVYGNDGKHVYLAGLGSNLLSVADTSSHEIVRQVGPFSASIRPFTINHDQSLCYVNVNGLLGFEIGDVQTGEMLHRVEVTGYRQGPVRRHGCPSHGIAMTPDETQIWVTDGHNECLHVFDATVMPPVQIDTIELREQPGWITFSLDGKTCWPSTGDVIDVASRRIISRLTDEVGRMVMSEKLLEIQFQGDDAVAVGDQFGKGMGAASDVQR